MEQEKEKETVTEEVEAEETTAPDVTLYGGKRYFSLKAAKYRFKIPQPTLYHWATNDKVEMLNLDEACTDLPFKAGDLRHQYYFEEESLMKRIRELRGDKIADELIEQ